MIRRPCMRVDGFRTNVGAALLLAAILSASGAASAASALYVGADGAAGSTCLGLLDEDVLDFEAEECPWPTAGDTPASAGSGEIVRETVVGVHYGDVDECYAVGPDGAQPCNYA